MINLLKFNKKYYQPIITGAKTQTIRKNNKRLDVGETVKAIFPGTTKECYLQITKAGYKQFKYLNNNDAKLEGYNSLDELITDLKKIYPLLDNLDRVWYYQFTLTNEE